ncbi:electron transport complex subunit RsxG [Alteromonas pelagimontana]|uniref:Ion-translocating oxidoreductase complex subunit G n=1 Tax=Alteromonas pelagimontana TaxID=1858656 RepID=A0A6M4MBH6_9ALTE|nr:electron transport complex subunit RsxG [Alteromonas pelagimontana]QJR79895.1 electron transport complex subunit RsxG [Alteromonas pelagimontana]
MFATISKNGGMLAAFALVTTALIAFTFFTTQEKIQDQQRLRLLSVLNEVVPAAYYDNSFYQDCTLVSAPMLGNNSPHVIYRARKNGEPSALAIETTAPDGYSGNIELVVGVDTQMNVLGVRAVEHQETPGLGDKIELAISDWILSFTGKQFDSESQDAWRVRKDGGQFDQFTGATITPRAVVGAVKETLLFVNAHQEALFSQQNDCATGNEETL